MKRLGIWLCLALLIPGCAGGLKTRQFRFYCETDATGGNPDINVFVNIVYPDSPEQGRQIMEPFDRGEGPEAWFGRHPLYEKAIKESLDVPPCGVNPHSPCARSQVNPRYKEHATCAIVIAEYGKRLPEPGSKTVIHLHPKETIPKPKRTEHILIGNGYMKRLRKTFWGKLKEM